MSDELFTSDGQRKYLTSDERTTFITAAREHERGAVRTFGLVLAYTGCRITEGLELTPRRIDLVAKTIIFRTLKQRDSTRYRAVPVPDALLDTVELVHGIRKALRGRRGQGDRPLWTWGRTQAWKHITELMSSAGIAGPHATPKGLRHGFGVQAATKTRNPRLIQKWLGHRDLNTTAIYMDAVGDEERAAAAATWE